jgi:hypothetical protein
MQHLKCLACRTRLQSTESPAGIYAMSAVR